MTDVRRKYETKGVFETVFVYFCKIARFRHLRRQPNEGDVRIGFKRELRRFEEDPSSLAIDELTDAQDEKFVAVETVLRSH